MHVRMYVCMYVCVLEWLRIQKDIGSIKVGQYVCMCVCMYVVPGVFSLLSLTSLVGDANTAIAGMSDHLDAHTYIHTYIHYFKY